MSTHPAGHATAGPQKHPTEPPTVTPSEPPDLLPAPPAAPPAALPPALTPTGTSPPRRRPRRPLRRVRWARARASPTSPPRLPTQVTPKPTPSTPGTPAPACNNATQSYDPLGEHPEPQRDQRRPRQRDPQARLPHRRGLGRHVPLRRPRPVHLADHRLRHRHGQGCRDEPLRRPRRSSCASSPPATGFRSCRTARSTWSRATCR